MQLQGVLPVSTGRGRPKLGEVTSVRLRPHPHEAVRRLAGQEEIDVTEWIRRAIDKEIARREGRCPTCGQKASAP